MEEEDEPIDGYVSPTGAPGLQDNDDPDDLPDDLPDEFYDSWVPGFTKVWLCLRYVLHTGAVVTNRADV